MTTRDFDPSRLDVAAFARAGASLEGRWPLRRFERLGEAIVAAAPEGGADELAWTVRGEPVAARGGGAAQARLHLRADASVALQCQRCLNPVAVALQIERSILFVHGEDAAAQLDAESDEDVLALTPALDLPALIEDECLLALPLVPRHVACPEPLPAASAGAAEVERASPFASLAALKGPRPPG